MKIKELIKELSDNLTDEQKEMEAHFDNGGGSIYPIDSMYVITKSASTKLPEGQVVFANIGDGTDD